MNYILDFLQNPDIEKTAIFPHLKCSKEEATFLKFLLKNYIKGIDDDYVFEFLNNFYKTSKIETIEKLDIINSLINKGWIIITNLNSTTNITTLELLNSTISLSITFLQLLENGSLDLIIPNEKPYTEHLEYLQDEFLKIDLYQQLSIYRKNYDNNSLNIKRILSKINTIETAIQNKLKISNIELPILDFFEEKKLDNKEKLIFFSLLKEEISGVDESIRDINSLLNLISNNEIERIKNRKYFEYNSKMITEGIIDYDEIFSPFGGFNKIFFLNEELVQQFLHPDHQKRKKAKIKFEAVVKEQTLFEVLDVKTDLDDVVLNEETKKILDTILKQMDKKVQNLLRQWGIKNSKKIEAKILFYGHPGTGKTMTAMSLAKSLKKPILSLDCSKILSMYVGESEKNVRKIFDDFKEITKKTKTEPILLLNEADQFLSNRSTSTSSSADKMHNQMQNIFLEQIEKFEGVLIATTNLLENIDSAFSRRFNYKVEFKKPTFKQRIELWKKMLPKNADYSQNFDIEKLAKFNLTGGQINLIIKNTAYKVAIKENPIFEMKDFLEEIKREQISTFGEGKEIGFL